MKTLSVAVVLLLFTGLVFAQKNSPPTEEYKAKALSIISPASSSIEFSNGSINWTIGETLVTLKVGDNGSANPEIFDFDIVAYPNPTQDNITISHDSKIDEKLTFTIYDFNGRTLIKKQLTEQENEINLQYMPPALYEVKITDSKNQHVKSFKIIKH